MPQPTYTTQGGLRTACVFSGTAGGDALLFSGAGRINYILPHGVQTSGVAVTFYDSAIAVSGGPLPASGHTIVGVLPATQSPVSGTVFFTNGSPIEVNMSFRSGLCIASRSGQVGVTVSYTPEVNTY